MKRSAGEMMRADELKKEIEQCATKIGIFTADSMPAAGTQIRLNIAQGSVDPWDRTQALIECSRELTVVEAPPKCSTGPGQMWLVSGEDPPTRVSVEAWSKHYQPLVDEVIFPNAEDAGDVRGDATTLRHDDAAEVSGGDEKYSNPQSAIRNPQSPIAPPYAAVLPPALIEAGDQPRKHFDETALFELGESMQHDTLLAPVIVNEIAPGRYRLIDGERRWRSAKAAGMPTVECRIYRGLSDAQVKQLQFASEFHKASWSIVEEADGLAAYQALTGETIEQMAKRFHRSADVIGRRLAIAKLPAEVKSQAGKDRLTVHHLVELTKPELTDAQRIDLATTALAMHWSADELRRHVNELIDPTLPGLGEATVQARRDDDAADDWRAVRLDTLGLGERTLACLAEHEPAIHTLGELTDWQAAKGEFWAKDIRGLGPAAADAIADACDAFWANRRRANPAPTPAAEPEDVPNYDDNDVPPYRDGRPPRSAPASKVPHRETTGPAPGAQRRYTDATTPRHDDAARDWPKELAPVVCKDDVGSTVVQISIAGKLSGKAGKSARLAKCIVTVRIGGDVQRLPGAVDLENCPGLERAVAMAIRQARKEASKTDATTRRRGDATKKSAKKRK